MRDKGSHAPSGSLGDVSGHSVNRLVKSCPTCGAGLSDRRKTYCGPCYAARLDANTIANRGKYYKPARGK
jgi:hypothetical protein